MTIRLNPEVGTWFYRFYRNGRSCFRGGFRTKDQAKEAERLHLNRVIEEGMLPEQAGREWTFKEAGQWFLDNHARTRKRSWKNDRGRIKVIGEFLGSKKLSQIAPTDVIALRTHVRKMGMSPSTVNAYHGQLKLVINRLKKLGLYAGENPAMRVEFERVPRTRPRFLYPYEEQVLTPAVRQNARLWPYYVTALHTGMRIGEICNIRVEHITMMNHSLFVPHSKSSRSRHVPLSETFARFLEEQISGKPPQQWALGGFSAQYVSRIFGKTCQAAGVKDLIFHDLRHTFAQRLLTKGVPIYKVSKILGHSSVVVTEQHYGHLSMADLREAVDEIDGVVSVDAGAICSQFAVAPNAHGQAIPETI